MFTCNLCQAQYVSRNGLNDHMDTIHKGIKYSCKTCLMTFGSLAGLVKHTNAVHKGIRYPCKLCDKVFMQQNNLDNDTRLHTGERPFVCQTCGQSYVAKKGLDRHLLTHLGEAGKKFKCTLCGKRTLNRTDLKNILQVTQVKDHTRATLVENVSRKKEVFKCINLSMLM